MKVSKQQAAENRDAILQVAATQIRERGFEQTSVADIAKAAGSRTAPFTATSSPRRRCSPLHWRVPSMIARPASQD